MVNLERKPQSVKKVFPPEKRPVKKLVLEFFRLKFLFLKIFKVFQGFSKFHFILAKLCSHQPLKHQIVEYRPTLIQNLTNRRNRGYLSDHQSETLCENYFPLTTKVEKKARLTLFTLNSALLSLTPELFEKYLNKIPSHKFMTQIFQNVGIEVEKVFWWEDKRSFEIF